MKNKFGEPICKCGHEKWDHCMVSRFCVCCKCKKYREAK